MGFLPKDYFEETKEYRPTTTTATFTKPKSETRKAVEKTVGGALKVIDFIEKPYYALMGIGKDIVGGEAGFHPIRAARTGIKERTDFGDILTEAGWQPESMVGKITKAGVSFVGGVLLDPITYVSFGAGKGIRVAGKVLSKQGEQLLLKQLSKKTGFNLKTFKDVKALGIGDKISFDVYEDAAKIVKQVADKNPNIYYNPRALRYFGKEIPVVNDFIKETGKYVKRGLEPLLSLKIVKEGVREGGRVVKTTTKSLGEMFSPGWDIRHSRHLTPEQKQVLLETKERFRVKKAVEEAENINFTRRLFNKLNKKKREQVAFEIEKLLKLFKSSKEGGIADDPLLEARKYKSAEEFIKAQKKIPVKYGTIKEWGTHNQYVENNPFRKKLDVMKRTGKYDMEVIKDAERWEIQQVLKDKPAFLSDNLSKEEVIKFAKDNNLPFSSITGTKYVVVAKDIDSLNRVLNALSVKGNQRELGLALGYEDIGLPKTRSQLIDIWNKAHNKDELINRFIENIQDEKVREVVKTFRQKMKDIWDEEIRLGIRKESDPIDEGYVKRILIKATSPEDVNSGFFNSRKLGGLTIQEAKEAYKAGKIDYMFETDAAKIMVARMNESTALKIKKEMVEQLEQTGLLSKMPKDVTKRNPNMVEFDFYGKKYEVYPELAREIKAINPKLVDTGIKNFLKFYDNLQDTWKLSVTSLWVSFHTRNAMSNVFLGWLAGNKNPSTYKAAFRVQNYARRIKAGKQAVDETITIGARKFKLSEIYKLAGENGVISTGWLGRDMIERLAINKSDLSFWMRQPQRFGTAVENNARIALFIDSLSKGDDVATATMKVKKFLFDYGDLTEFEREVMKRVVPFYTYLRKNIPLQLEQLIQQPAKYAGVWHAKEGIETMSAAQEEQYLPEWMREGELYVRLPNKFYWNPDLPFQDLAKLAFKDRVVREIVSGISPLIKGFFEVAANKDIFRNKPLANQKLPPSKLLRAKIKQEFLNNMRFTSVWKRASSEDRTLFSNFLDLVFGLNVTPFDIQKGREMYLQRIQGEQQALRELELKKQQKESIFTKFRE